MLRFISFIIAITMAILVTPMVKAIFDTWNASGGIVHDAPGITDFELAAWQLWPLGFFVFCIVGAILLLVRRE